MTLSLFSLLTVLALTDALNPFTVAAQAYLLGTPRPMPRSIAFLLALTPPISWAASCCWRVGAIF